MFCKNEKITFKNYSSKYFLKTLFLENVNGGEILQSLFEIKEFYLISLNAINSNLTDNTLILSFPNLRLLNLSLNSIKILRSQHFSKTILLEKLLLINNNFKMIEKNAFENLNNLIELHVMNSNLQFLTKNLFPKSNKLKKLMIKNSKILSIDKRFFKNLYLLEELNFLKSDLDGENVISQLDFQSNKKLSLLISDYYTLCCFLKKHHPSSKCLPKNIDSFTCENLIGSITKKSLETQLLHLFVFFSSYTFFQ